MKKYSFIFLFFFAFVSLFAQGEQKFAQLGNFELENGDTILNCKIGYRTFGKLNEEKI